jgi:hypothetical protein
LEQAAMDLLQRMMRAVLSGLREVWSINATWERESGGPDVDGFVHVVGRLPYGTLVGVSNDVYPVPRAVLEG